MTNPFYNSTGVPSTRSQGSSAAIRAEFALIAAAFNKFPAFSGNAKRLLGINASEDALEVVTSIDSTPIGATVPSSATFTTLAATTASIGNLTVTSTLDVSNISVVNLTTTGNTILGNAASDTLNVGAGGIIKDASGNVGLSVTPSGVYRLQVSGSISGANYAIGTQSNADAGTFGFSNASGPGITTWGTATAGAGKIEFTAAGARQVQILPVASAVNYLSLSGNTAGNGPVLSALGSDTNVQMNFATQGSGSFAFFTGGFAQFLVGHTASATRYVSVTGANGGNPAIGTSGGMLAVTSPARFTAAGNTGGDVASTYSLLDGIRLDFVDSSRSANNRQTEFIWFSGQLLGRFNNDAYSSATNWLTVSGGQSSGVSSVTLHTAAGVPALTLDSSQNATISGGIVLGTNIGGPSTNFSYTIGANPLASVTSGGFIQLYGSTAGTPNLVIIGNGNGTGLKMDAANLLFDKNNNELGFKGMPAASVTTGAFVAADRGKCVYATGNVTIPNATMAGTDVVVIQNTTGSGITITKTITTAYNCTTGTALGATFTLGARGRMAILFESGTVCDISGNIS